MTRNIENFSLNYFCSRALFLGIGFSLILRFTKQDSIIAYIIGTIISIPFILMINKINKEKNTLSLSDYLTNLGLIGKFIKILYLIFGILLLLESFSFMQLFVSSFILVKTPLFFISLPILLLLFKINSCKNDVIYRVSACLLPISLFLTFLSLIGLISYAEFDVIKPLFVSNKINFLRSVFYYVSLSISPSILLLVTEAKKNVKSYLLGSLTLICKMFLILAIIGPTLASIYRFPEYIVLKEIKLLNFIEKIENIVALSWIIDIFIYLSMSSLFIKELLPKKKNKLINMILLTIIYFISFIYIGKYYTNEIIIYYTLPIITFIIFILTIPYLFLKSLKK